jgi:ABC-2 type transport system permease protein
VQAISAIESVPATPVVHAGRNWSRAFQDIREGFAARELWGHLGWQDIKQRYRRSVIGPLWITLSMGVTATGLGLLYSQLFNSPIATFLPYLTVGFIVWNFILGCLTEGSDAFISNEGLIKHLPAPLTVYALRTVWRLTLMFLHNLAVYAVVLVVFFGPLSTPGYVITDGGTPQPGLSWSALLAIPAFALIAINGAWVAVLFGIISTRYRDIPQVVAALTQLVFFVTPIVWSTDLLDKRFGAGGGGWAKLVAELNPAYHFIQILRAPLLGNTQSWHHWVFVGVVTVVGWALALLAMRNYRARISYWV